SRMARLRDSLAAAKLLGAHVRLVSITVDPARDTPDVLRRYAARFGGSPPDHWAFLTGEPPETVRRLVQQGFKVTAALDPVAQPDPAASYQVQHTPRIMLVDRTGRVRGTYDATEPGVVATVIADLQVLLKEPEEIAPKVNGARRQKEAR
ncbi:MAG: SCO family protein, partial [Dehalococcoidia bacterium]